MTIHFDIKVEPVVNTIPSLNVLNSQEKQEIDQIFDQSPEIVLTYTLTDGSYRIIAVNGYRVVYNDRISTTNGRVTDESKYQ